MITKSTLLNTLQIFAEKIKNLIYNLIAERSISDIKLPLVYKSSQDDYNFELTSNDIDLVQGSNNGRDIIINDGKSCYLGIIGARKHNSVMERGEETLTIRMKNPLVYDEDIHFNINNKEVILKSKRIIFSKTYLRTRPDNTMIWGKWNQTEEKNVYGFQNNTAIVSFINELMNNEVSDNDHTITTKISTLENQIQTLENQIQTLITQEQVTEQEVEQTVTGETQQTEESEETNNNESGNEQDTQSGE